MKHARRQEGCKSPLLSIPSWCRKNNETRLQHPHRPRTLAFGKKATATTAGSLARALISWKPSGQPVEQLEHVTDTPSLGRSYLGDLAGTALVGLRDASGELA